MTRRFATLVLVISFGFLSGRSTGATPSLSKQEIRVDWHMAAFSEATGDWGAARKNFYKVIDDAEFLTLPVREWYRGMAWLGISRASARLRDTVQARLTLVKAFEHGFNNCFLVSSDTAFTAVAGQRFTDSVGQFWHAIQQANSAEWMKQSPIVFRPRHPQPDQPLIIALHGGNESYLNFASYWEGVAEKTQATIVVPAGIIRNSETSNSWEYEMASVAPQILSLVQEYTGQFDSDPNQVYLAGYSQGAQAAIALTLSYPTVFRGAISFAGFLFAPITDSTLRVAAHHNTTRIFALSGDLDSRKFVTSLETARDYCHSIGIPFRLEIGKEMVHEVPLDFPQRFEEAWHWVRQDEPVAGQHAGTPTGQ